MKWETMLIVALNLATQCHVGADELPSSADVRDDNEVLSRADVRKELEMTDEQIKELESVNKPFQRELTKLLSERELFTAEEWIAKMREFRSKVHTAQTQARADVLLPHQLDRLVELRWQYLICFNGSGTDRISC